FYLTAATDISTRSLHDALPIFSAPLLLAGTLRDYQLEDALRLEGGEYDPSNSTLEYLGTYLTGAFVTLSTLLQDSGASRGVFDLDRKSTRLNSSHVKISYAVFC